MLELGKRDNGVTIFDKENLVKVDITGQRMSDFIVYFDTSVYDKLSGPHSFWFIYFLFIVRKENSNICVPFDNFHKKAFEEVLNNRKKYENYTSFGNNMAILRTNGGSENYQIQYPSDDDGYFDATLLGITKYKELGYSLDFEKTSKNLDKLGFLLKSYGSRYPKLAVLFEECFTNLRDIATRSYEECNEEFGEEVKRRLEK